MKKSTKTRGPNAGMAKTKPHVKSARGVNHTRPKVGKAQTEANGPNVSRGSKLGSVVTMLREPTGASIEDLCQATGWQAHSVRAVLSATIKKKLGLKVTSERVDGVRRYRVMA